MTVMDRFKLNTYRRSHHRPAYQVGNAGEWSITYGPSKLAVASGPGATIHLGRKIFGLLQHEPFTIYPKMRRLPEEKGK